MWPPVDLRDSRFCAIFVAKDSLVSGRLMIFMFSGSHGSFAPGKGRATFPSELLVLLRTSGNKRLMSDIQQFGRLLNDADFAGVRGRFLSVSGCKILLAALRAIGNST
jgi:hypothetical protein